MGKKKRPNDDGDASEIMLQTLENQVSETKDIMRDNIEKMHERHGKLDDLEQRADVLSNQTTTEFKQLAIKAHTQAKRKSRRCTYMLYGTVVVTFIVVLFLILYAAGAFSGDDGNAESNDEQIKNNTQSYL